MLSFPKDKTNFVPIAFMHCPLYPWNILFLLSLKEPIVRHLFTTSHVPCKCTNKILFFFCTFSLFLSWNYYTELKCSKKEIVGYEEDTSYVAMWHVLSLGCHQFLSAWEKVFFGATCSLWHNEVRERKIIS